jgi:hypothetical protein
MWGVARSQLAICGGEMIVLDLQDNLAAVTDFKIIM